MPDHVFGNGITSYDVLAACCIYRGCMPLCMGLGLCALRAKTTKPTMNNQHMRFAERCACLGTLLRTRCGVGGGVVGFDW